MKKFWPSIAILTAMTAASFFVDERVRAFMLTIHSTQLDYFMFFFSQLGGLAVGVPFIIIAVLLLESSREKKLASNLIAALAIDLIITVLLKFTFNRERPPEQSEISGLEAYLSSFPSSHSSRAFAMFYILNVQYKKPFFFYTAAALVATSRVYFGVHYLSDVLAGATLGLVIAHFVNEKNIGGRISDKIFKGKNLKTKRR